MSDEEKKDVGHLLAEVFMASNQENFDENVTKFLDDTAEILGDVIGAACSDPSAVLTRFGEVMINAAQKKLESSNVEVTGSRAATPQQ